MSRVQEGLARNSIKFAVGFGFMLVIVGVILAVGQMAAILGAPWLPGIWVASDVADALQLHMSIMALGMAVVAGSWAYGAFTAQKEELANAEKQLELLKQSPWIEVSFPKANGQGRIEILPTELDGPYGQPRVEVSLSNTGHKIASVYQITLSMPKLLREHNLVDQFQPHVDKYSQGVLLTYYREESDTVHFFWNVINDRGYYLFPNNEPTIVPLLQVNCHRDGAVGSVWSYDGIWNIEHPVRVAIVGEWGQQPEKEAALILKKTRVLERFGRRSSLTSPKPIGGDDNL